MKREAEQERHAQETAVSKRRAEQIARMVVKSDG
jgi:hypothetical protein